jgi:hypothetical protein
MDADFADREELHLGRMQTGELRRTWRPRDDGSAELEFDYTAEHTYQHQGNEGTRRIHRSLIVHVHNSDSPARLEDGRIKFEVTLAPHQKIRCRSCATPLPNEFGASARPSLVITAEQFSNVGQKPLRPVCLDRRIYAFNYIGCISRRRKALHLDVLGL